jgi:hypothetical protein
MNPAGFSRRRIQFNPGTVSWLLDHLIRSHQHVGRNRQADLLRRLEIYHQLELRRPLHRQIGRLGAFKDFVDVEAARRLQISMCQSAEQRNWKSLIAAGTPMAAFLSATGHNDSNPQKVVQ